MSWSNRGGSFDRFGDPVFDEPCDKKPGAETDAHGRLFNPYSGCSTCGHAPRLHRWENKGAAQWVTCSMGCQCAGSVLFSTEVTRDESENGFSLPPF